MLIKINNLLFEEYKKIEGFDNDIYSNEELINLLIKKQLIQSGNEKYKYHILLNTFLTKYKFYKDILENNFSENEKIMIHLHIDNLKLFLDTNGHKKYENLLLKIESDIRNIFQLNKGYIINLNTNNLDIGIILNENNLTNIELNFPDKINISFGILDLNIINFRNLNYKDIVNSIMKKSNEYNINNLVSILFNIKN